jgi:hypothetical protein
VYSMSWGVKFLWLGFFSPSPNPQAGGPLLARCPCLLIQHMCSYRPFFGGFLCHPQPEETSCCGDRDSLIREIEM